MTGGLFLDSFDEFWGFDLLYLIFCNIYSPNRSETRNQRRFRQEIRGGSDKKNARSRRNARLSYDALVRLTSQKPIVCIQA